MAMTEQEARLIAKAIANELGGGNSRNSTPRVSEKFNTKDEVSKLNNEIQRLNNMSLFSSFKKYGEEVIGALKYGTKLQAAMEEFKKTLQEISDATEQQSKNYVDELIKLISSQKMAATETLELTQNLKDFETALRKGSTTSTKYEKEILAITKKFGDLDNIVKKNIDEMRIAAKNKDEKRMDALSLGNSSSQVAANYANFSHFRNKIIQRQMDELPAMIIAGIRKGIVTGGKVTFDAMQAQMKYNVPTSTFGANLGRLNVSEAEAAQSMAENRFGYRMISGTNSAVSGYTNLSADVKNALLQYGPAGGTEALKALQTSQENLSKFGVNYGNQTNIANQLNMFKNLRRSVGETDSGLQRFTDALVHSGVIATLESEKKFKTAKEEEKYIAKEIKERINLSRALGLNREEMSTMQQQGISNSFMGLQEYIMNRYVKPNLMAAQASMVGMNMSRQQIRAVALYNTGNLKQKAAAAPEALAVLSQYFKHITNSSGITGKILQSQVGMGGESQQAATATNKAIATFLTLASHNEKVASILGVNGNQTITQKRARIETYLSNVGTNADKNTGYQYLLSQMSKGTASSTKIPNQTTLGIPDEEITKLINSIKSLEKNPFGGFILSMGGMLKGVIEVAGGILLENWAKAGFTGLISGARGIFGGIGDLTAGIGEAATATATFSVATLGAATAAAGLGYAIGTGINDLPKLWGGRRISTSMGAELNRHGGYLKTGLWAASFGLYQGGNTLDTNKPLNNVSAGWKRYEMSGNGGTAKNYYDARIRNVKNLHKTEGINTFQVGKTEMNIGEYVTYLQKQERHAEKAQEALHKIRHNTAATAKHVKQQVEETKRKNEAEKVLNNSPQALAMKHAQDIVSGVSSYADKYH